MWFFKKNVILTISLSDKEEYEVLFSTIRDLLNNSGNEGQALVIENLMNLLSIEITDDFLKLINSVDMWGGSGAVWEVNIDDENKYKCFQQAIINLIDLMERTGVLKYLGIKSRRRLFRRILNNNPR